MENLNDAIDLDESNSPGSWQRRNVLNEVTAVSSSSEPNLDSDVVEKSPERLVNSTEVDMEEAEQIFLEEDEEARDRNMKVTAVSSSSKSNLDSDVVEKSAERIVNSTEVDMEEAEQIFPESNEAECLDRKDEARDVSKVVNVKTDKQVFVESLENDKDLDETKDLDLEEEIDVLYECDTKENWKKEADVFDEKRKDEKNIIGETPDIVLLSSGEDISLDGNSPHPSENVNKSMEMLDDNENSVDENCGEKSRAVDESSIPYFSLPKPQEYGAFKSTVAKSLQIGIEKSSEPKKVTLFASPKEKDDKDDDIIFLGVFETPPKMYPGPSRSRYITPNSVGWHPVGASSDDFGAGPSSGPSSARGPSTRMLNYEIAPRIGSSGEALLRNSIPNRPHSTACETPGAKHMMLKKNLMEKMRHSKEQKFKRQKEMESIDNEEKESDEEEFNEEEDDCDQINVLHSIYGTQDSDVEVVGGASTADAERRDADSPLLFSSLPSYQPGGGFKNPERRDDSIHEEIPTDCDVMEINSDVESCEEVAMEAISSSKSVESFHEKIEATIPHKSCWGSPITFDEDSVSEICSGAFPATNNSEQGPEDSVTSWKSGHDEVKSSNWTYRISKEVISDKSTPSSKEVLSSSSDPKESDNNSGESDQLMDEESVSSQKKRKLNYSEEEDDENETSSYESREIRDDSPISSPVPFIAKSKNRRYLSESDDSGDEVHMDDEIPQDNVEDLKIKRPLYKDFVEDEAELSGEEYSSDENEDALSVTDEVDAEAEEVEVSETELLEMGKIHLKKTNADDDQLLKKIKNDFLDEGELHNEDGERSRKFKWSTPSTSQDVAIIESSDSEDDENKAHVDHEKLKWLKEASANAPEDLHSEKLPSEKKMKLNILSKNNISVKENEAEKKSKVKRGSLLKKDGEAKDVPKDSAKKTSTPKRHFFGSTQDKPPEADPL